MARPNKYNLDYFPLDVDCFDDHKILSIEEDFGVKGGYIAIRIMAMVYKDNGYYLEWPDKFEYTIAKRVGNSFTGALVGEIFNSCMKHELFDKQLFDQHKVVTSKGIQKRWLEVMRGMRRKISVSSELWLISSEEIHVSSEETAPSVTLSTQKEKKVKEIKQNESNTSPKGDGNSPAANVPPDNHLLFKNMEKTKELIVKFIRLNKPDFIEPYAELWNLFAEEKKLAKIQKITNTRTKKFKVRIGEKSFDFLQILKKASLSQFLLTEKWFGFDWIVENESNYLKVIEGNYDKKETADQKPNFTLPPRQLPKIERDINEHYIMFKENRLKPIWVQVEEYDYMLTRGLKLTEAQKECTKESLREFMIAENFPNEMKTIEALSKCFAVIEHFKTLKQRGNVTVFGMD